jgi:hypothetical protein
MLPESCQLALRKLLVHEPPLVPELAGRDFERSTPAMVRPDKEAVEAYFWERRQIIVRDASNFVYELETAQLTSQLERRVSAFEEIKRTGGAFDISRDNFCQLLVRKLETKEYISDWDPAHVTFRSTRRVIYVDDDSRPEFKAPNALERILRWNQSTDLVWRDLSSNLADVGQLAKWSSEAEIHDWHLKLREMNTRNEREHLLGCFLLRWCYLTRNVNPSDSNLEDRLHRHKEEWARFTESIRLAAEHLSAQTSPSESIVPDQPSSEEGETWFHSADMAIPEKYRHGPLRGNQQLLAEAICKHAGREPDTRGLQALGKIGVVWIVRHAAHDNSVYFQDYVLWSESNSSWKILQNSKDSRKNRKKSQDDTI